MSPQPETGLFEAPREPLHESLREPPHNDPARLEALSSDAPPPERRCKAHEPGAACLRAALQLCLTTGLGAGTARRLTGAFGCACATVSAPPPALQALLTPRVAHALLAPDAAREREIERALAWAGAPGQHLLCAADPRYPSTLAALADPPPVLYVRGDPAALSRPAIAIVGSRNASRDGLEIARSVASAFARAGIVVVSGLAAGIDSAAHQGALAAGGLTVGYIGTGADLIYPRAHRALAESVIAQGALVSELPLGSPAAAHHFPRRNRLIAAQASAVVVVQAARFSGSLITARLAAELGREVAVFPGSVHSPLSHGCHQLIREGAALVENAGDIAELLATALARSGELAAGIDAQPDAAPATRSPRAQPGNPAARQLLKALGWAPASASSLAQTSGLGGAEVAAALVDLELAGEVERLIDGRFQRVAQPTPGQPAGLPFPPPDPLALLASPTDRPV